MKSDIRNFIFENQLVTKVNNEEFYSKTWNDRVLRNGV